MLKLRLAGIRLRWNADAEHERQPVLKLWLSRDVSDTVHTFSLPEEIRTSSHPLDLPVLEFAPVTQNTSRVSLLERAKHCDINFAIFVPMRNKNQETCLNQSGDARVPLHAVLGERKLVPRWKLSITSWGDPNNHLENNDPTIVNDKGTLSFEGADVSLTLPDGVTVVPRLTDAEAATHDRVQRFKDKLLYNYMLSTVRFFGERDYSQENIRDINAFVFAGHCGLLPACAYLGTRPTGAEVGYFEHCARIVFARHKLDPASFDWKSDSRAASLLSRVLTLPANLLVYVPDLVFFRSAKNPSVFIHKTLESFDSAFARGGGDCEDLALAVILCGLQLLAARATEPDNPVVQGLAWVREQYVQGMVLGGVTSAEINGDYGHQEMGAHMYVYPRFNTFIFSSISLSLFPCSFASARVRFRARLWNSMARSTCSRFWLCSRYGRIFSSSLTPTAEPRYMRSLSTQPPPSFSLIASNSGTHDFCVMDVTNRSDPFWRFKETDPSAANKPAMYGNDTRLAWILTR